jgi:hypothetical protein
MPGLDPVDAEAIEPAGVEGEPDFGLDHGDAQHDVGSGVASLGPDGLAAPVAAADVAHATDSNAAPRPAAQPALGRTCDDSAAHSLPVLPFWELESYNLSSGGDNGQLQHWGHALPAPPLELPGLQRDAGLSESLEQLPVANAGHGIIPPYSLNEQGLGLPHAGAAAVVPASPREPPACLPVALTSGSQGRAHRSEWHLERLGRQRAKPGYVLGRGTFGTAITFQQHRTLVVKKIVNTLMLSPTADRPPRATPAVAAPAPHGVHGAHEVTVLGTDAGVSKGEGGMREPPARPDVGTDAARPPASPVLVPRLPVATTPKRPITGLLAGTPAVRLVAPAKAAAQLHPSRTRAGCSGRAYRLQQFAVKLPSRPIEAPTFTSPGVVIAPGATSCLEKEVKVYSCDGLTSHPNVVRYLGEGGRRSGHDFHILLEYCSGGSATCRCVQRKPQPK